MKEPGYIYVMVNPSMEGLVKIGKTTRDPQSRAKELSQATGVATPFYVAFNIFVSDCHSAEEFVHAVLEHKGFRNTVNREFFQMPLRQAIEVLMLAEKELQKAAGEDAPQEQEGPEDGTTEADETDDVEVEKHPGQEIFDQAIKIYYGEGDEIEDQDEAVRLLYRAKALNYPAAFTSLAQHFQNLADEVVHCAADWQMDAFLANREKALALLKEGAQKGHGRCWISLAFLYRIGWARDHKPDPVSENRCWKNYFRSETFREDNDDKWTRNSSGVGKCFPDLAKFRRPVNSILDVIPGNRDGEEFLHPRSRGVRLPSLWSFCRFRRHIKTHPGDRRDPLWSELSRRVVEDIEKNPQDGDLLTHMERVISAWEGPPSSVG